MWVCVSVLTFKQLHSVWINVLIKNKHWGTEADEWHISKHFSDFFLGIKSINQLIYWFSWLMEEWASRKMCFHLSYQLGTSTGINNEPSGTSGPHGGRSISQWRHQCNVPVRMITPTCLCVCVCVCSRCPSHHLDLVFSTADKTRTVTPMLCPAPWSSPWTDVMPRPSQAAILNSSHLISFI